MRQRRRYNRAGNYFMAAASVVVCLLVFGAPVGAQSNDSKRAESAPLTVCELLKNSKKYKNKEVQVRFFYDIAAETALFRHEADCRIFDGVVVDTDESFESVNDAKTIARFYKATRLQAAQREAAKKMPTFNFQWGSFLRVELNARGIFHASKKRRYGHLESYKYMFLITKVEEIGQSKLLMMTDSFKKDPEPILIVDYNQ